VDNKTRGQQRFQISRRRARLCEAYLCIKKIFVRFLTSLLEEHDHRVPDVEANIAAIVVGYRVAALFNHKAVPVPLILTIKLLFDLPRYV
jgi:hypothetical protein